MSNTEDYGIKRNKSASSVQESKINRRSESVYSENDEDIDMNKKDVIQFILKNYKPKFKSVTKVK